MKKMFFFFGLLCSFFSMNSDAQITTKRISTVSAKPDYSFSVELVDIFKLSDSSSQVLLRYVIPQIHNIKQPELEASTILQGPDYNFTRVTPTKAGIVTIVLPKDSTKILFTLRGDDIPGEKIGTRYQENRAIQIVDNSAVPIHWEKPRAKKISR
jgi:hypothetical protein